MPTIMLILETEKGPATGENRRESIGSPFRLCSLPNRYSVYRPVFFIAKDFIQLGRKEWIGELGIWCGKEKVGTEWGLLLIGYNIKTMIWTENEKKKKEAQQPAA